MLNPAPLFVPKNSIHLLEAFSPLGQSLRLLMQGAFRRGLIVEGFNDKMYRLSDGKQHFDMYLGMSSRVPYVTRLQTNSKSLSKMLMSRAGLPVPAGQQFMPADVDAAWEFAKPLLPVVVKPAVGAFSKNVTVRISDEEGFRAAFALAAQGRRFQVVVENYIEGFDYRVLIIGDEVRACTLRRYGSVLGNGEDTVEALINAANLRRQADPLASTWELPHKPGVHYDRFPEIVDYAAVPDIGQRVFLRDDKFVLEGRDMVDCTEEIHPEFCRIALRAREIFGPMPSFGLDLLAPDISAHPDSQNWGFCEINLNAGHSPHHLAMEGIRRDTAGCILGDLFPNATLEREEQASESGLSISIVKLDKDVVTDVEHAIALHSLEIQSHAQDATHALYSLTGKDFLVESFLDWIDLHCAHEDFSYAD